MPPKKLNKLVKFKRPIIKSKGRISSLEQMDNPLNKVIQKNLNKYTSDKKVKEDSDYSCSNSGSDSDSNDDDFKPYITYRPKNIKKENLVQPKFNDLNIKAIPTVKTTTPLNPMMEAGIVPKPNGCHLINGAIASGKSNMLANMLLNPNIWGGFFDNIFLFANSNDDVYDSLIEKGIIKRENIKHNPEEADIKRVLRLQKDTIKNANGDPSKYPTTLIILDDIIDNLQLMKSDAMKLLFIRPRQMFITTVILSQYALSVPKLARMQCINLLLFAGNAQESEMYYEWLAPSGMSRKDFEIILKTAWDKKPNDKYPFLHVCRKEPPNTRFRRNFLELITLETSANE